MKKKAIWFTVWFYYKGRLVGGSQVTIECPVDEVDALINGGALSDPLLELMQNRARVRKFDFYVVKSNESDEYEEEGQPSNFIDPDYFFEPHTEG